MRSMQLKQASIDIGDGSSSSSIQRHRTRYFIGGEFFIFETKRAPRTFSHFHDERTSTSQETRGAVYGCIYNPGSLCIHTREGQTFAQLLFLQMPGRSRKKRRWSPSFSNFWGSTNFPPRSAIECKRIFLVFR